MLQEAIMVDTRRIGTPIDQSRNLTGGQGDSKGRRLVGAGVKPSGRQGAKRSTRALAFGMPGCA